jgi:hypothetical protein
MEQFLCKGLGLELMGVDGQIANMVIDYFTKQNEPVLCIHDSFLINYKKGEELRRIVSDCTFQLTGYRIQQDIKNKRIETTTPVKGNIEGYKEPVDLTFYTPNRIERTDQYVARRDKFYKWKELKMSNLFVVNLNKLLTWWLLLLCCYSYYSTPSLHYWNKLR